MNYRKNLNVIISVVNNINQKYMIIIKKQLFL